MIREGPGGRVAVQLPPGPVVTAAAWVNAFEPLSGAVRIATGWPAIGTPALLISSPCSLTGRPKATLADVASLAADEPQLLLRLLLPSHGCLRDRRSLLGVRQRHRAAPRGAIGEGASRSGRRRDERGAKSEKPAVRCESETRCTSQSSLAHPPVRTSRRWCSSIVLDAWTCASRSGDSLEAHLRDGLSPDRQHDRPSGRGAVADVVAGSNAEGVRAAHPGVVEMSYELASGEGRGQSRPAPGSRRGHLDRSSRDTRLAVTRIDDHPGRVVRVHGLQAHRRWGLVDVNRDRTGPGVMVALRVDSVVPGGAGDSSHPVAVDRQPARRIALRCAAIDAAAHPAKAGWAGAGRGVDRNPVVDPHGRIRVIGRGERHAHWVVVDIQRFRHRSHSGARLRSSPASVIGSWAELLT